jgi:iron complex outermembrane receptor protein
LLTGGLRISRDDKAATIANLVRTITPSVLGGPILVNASCPSATAPCTQRFENVSPRAIVTFKPTADNTLYASFSKGFNSGGFNNFGNVAVPTDPTNPLENSSEKITSYEIGSKNEFFDRRLRLNLSAFQTDYADLHIRQAVLSGGVSIVNVPKARVRGIELESIVAPVDNLTFTLNGAYLDGKIQQGNLATLASNVGSIRFGNQVAPVTENVAGNDLTRAPRWQGYASANYSVPTNFGSIGATGTFRFQSETWFSETNQDIAQYLSESWQEVDLRLSVTGASGWEVAVYGRNVFDNRHISQIVPFNGFPIATLNTPRTWGVSGKFKF